MEYHAARCCISSAARSENTIGGVLVSVIYHTDGGVMEAVEGLIDARIDVLQALQFSAKGMDPAVLKQRFGDRLCFEGGVSVQTTLPSGDPDAVRTEHVRAEAVSNVDSAPGL